MIAALFGVGVLFSPSPSSDEKPPTAVEDEVERVARKLERVRKLRFDEIPPVRLVSAEEARAEALELLDSEYPPEERRTDELLLTMLGLVPEGTELRELVGAIFGEEVAGYYDERKKRMTIVGEDEPDEITLAHELTHALEDQRFGIGGEESSLDDAVTAETALYEGTATIAMLDYLDTGVGRRRLLGQLDLASLFGSKSLPPYVQHSLLFPYVAGARFVDAIGTWGPANRALRSRPPASTEQVLHPEKYRAGEEPLPVRLRGPGPGWRRAVGGTVGEFDTAELIRTADSKPRADLAAAGWGGGRYALWRRGDGVALALGWRWDTPRDGAEFAAALHRYVERTLAGARGFVQVAVGPTVRLAIAPTRALARRLVAASPRPRVAASPRPRVAASPRPRG